MAVYSVCNQFLLFQIKDKAGFQIYFLIIILFLKQIIGWWIENIMEW